MTRKPEPARPVPGGRAKDSSDEATGAKTEMESAGERARRLLAVRFREARAAAGLTQKEVHERSRVDIASISKIESADWNPSLNTLVRLALAMGVPVGALLAEGPADAAPEAGGASEPDEDPTSEG